ncbi:AAA family ATPase [Pseudofrankia sp. DC12]|uniref:AAA family ATPase n=1 Tax=Pseudofrankia sp. DC12 TaxID=683315 RepID=UPI0005F88539|nr:AAA family ATPase [Pseudofrankia sp. DC12]
MADEDAPRVRTRARILKLRLNNFLSYRDATLDLGDLVALVGPNASGKSNAVAGIKLLRDVAIVGLPASISRRGGFDQLRHRSHGHPYDPSIRIDFSFGDDLEGSFYELRLRALSGKRYEVKEERARINLFSGRSVAWSFDRLGDRTRIVEQSDGVETRDFEVDLPVDRGQSILPLGLSRAATMAQTVLAGLQIVEINPARVAEFQEASSTNTFEPDGSNAVGVYDTLETRRRRELVDELAAIVPGIQKVEVERFADRLTLAFLQGSGEGRNRRFLARYMSDGTLRAFGILLALQAQQPSLLVVEEPEVAIHLGALQTLVDVLRQHSDTTQVLLTTHSADIVDSLGIEALRVVWSDGNASHIAPVAEHTRETVRSGLITPGELLRVDSLDPAVA